MIYPVVPLAASDSSRQSRLVVVRHGSTTWSREGRHTGRTDVALDEQGIRAARALAGPLSSHPFVRVLASPLHRARQTGDLAGFADRAEICDDLAEWDYGSYEGLTTQQICARHPGWSLWGDGVEGGESLEEVARRADRVVAEVRGVPGDTLAFAHGHILRIVCVRWIEMAAVEGAHFLLDPAAVGVLGWEREEPAVTLWNECAGGDWH